MSPNTPKVTVLMPVYNGEKYLSEAIESILKQSYTDFEFIIINDGSTDRTVEIINSYKDPRIILHSNQQNLSIAVSLNKGIAATRGKYIARMDCDDISLPLRLERQANFLDEHPEVGVLGCRVKIINKFRMVISERERPQSHHCNRWVALFKPPVMHPCVMYRTDVVRQIGGYNIKVPVSQDYELWSRLIEKTKFQQLNETLVILRIHDSNIGSTRRKEQREKSLSICEKNLHRLMNHSGGIRNPRDVARFARRESSCNTSDAEIYLSLIKIFATFMQKYELPKNDKAWIANRFLVLFWPYFSLRHCKKLDILLKIISEQSINFNNKIYIANTFLFRLLHLGKKQFLENIQNKIRVLAVKKRKQ